MPDPLSPEKVILEIKSARDPRISPDGETIVSTLATVNRETKKTATQLWACDRDGSHARQLTFSGAHNSGARFSPDGTTLAFVSDRVPQQTTLLLLPLGQPGEAREVTRHRPGISEPAWAPDGQHLAYTCAYDPDNPDEAERPEGEPAPVRVTRRLDYKFDGRGYLGEVRSQVWVVEVASGARRRLTEEAIDHTGPRWSPEGRRIAARVSLHDSTRSRIALIDVATGAQERIGPEDGRVGAFAWSPDGAQIVYLADAERNDQMDFYLYDVASGETRRLTDDFAAAPDMASAPVWLEARQVLYHGVDHGASILGILDVDSGTTEVVQRWQALNSGLSVDRTGRYVVQIHNSFTHTGEISLLDRQTGDCQLITHLNDDLLSASPSADWERIEVQRGEFMIEAWLLKPPDFDPAKRYPLIIDIHGGPHGHFGYGFNATQQCLATNGFLVIAANPRGSTSYGRAFTQQVNRDWGGEDYHDLMAVVDTILERPYVDPNRTGIAGYSYGGYMTSWIIGQTQRFKACVCGAPVFDIESEWGTSDISHGAGETSWLGAPHEHPEWYAAHSASNFAHHATTPTMIVQGEADYRCPVGQSEQLFVTLKKAGCEVEFVRYPGMSHGFRNAGPPAYREDLMRRTLDWFRRHLGGPV